MKSCLTLVVDQIRKEDVITSRRDRARYQQPTATWMWDTVQLKSRAEVKDSFLLGLK